MTVTATTRKQTFPGAGSTGPFTFDFYTFLNNDGTPQITVTKVVDATGVKAVLTTPADYSFTAIGLGLEGGSITLGTALAIGETLVVAGNTSALQPTRYSNQGAFFPESHEYSFDRLTLLNQERFEELSRSPKFSVASSVVNVEIADPVTNAVLTWDSNGNIVNSTSVVGSNLTPTGGTNSSELVDLFGRMKTPYDFGAVGDGVTDDTVAMKAFFGSTAKNLFIAGGAFRITDSLQNGTEVLLSSVDGRKIHGPGVITATDVVLLAVKNTGDGADIQINIDGNTQIANGLENDGAVNVKIHHCFIRNMYRASGASVGILCDMDGVDGSVQVTDNIIFNVNCPTGFARGIGCNADQDMLQPSLIANNIIVGVIGQEGDSITFVSSDSGVYYNWNMTVINNEITTYTRRAIKSQANGYRVAFNKIVNTYTDILDVPNMNAAIDATLGSDYTVQGNELINNLFAAQIKVDADTDVVNNVVIKDNIIRGIGAETTNTMIFADINGANLDISGNKIFCPNFDGNVIVISRVAKGSVINNTIIVDEGSGAVPFQESSCTDIVEFNNISGSSLKSISRSLTIDYENRRVGVNTESPTSVLDVDVGNDSNKAMRLSNPDTTLSSGELVHALEFKQNDASSPDTVHAAIRTYAVGSSGLLEMRIYTRAGEHRLTIDTAGNILPATDDSQDLGSASLQYNDLYFNNRILKGGTQILTSQQAAVADATDAASAITQLNSLLAKLRTHGLIAT
jgi:hypothetical protein